MARGSTHRISDNFATSAADSNPLYRTRVAFSVRKRVAFDERWHRNTWRLMPCRSKSGLRFSDDKEWRIALRRQFGPCPNRLLPKYLCSLTFRYSLMRENSDAGM